MQQPNDTKGELRWEAAARTLKTEIPPGLESLFAPPSAAAQDEMISRVLRRRPAPMRARRRWAWFSAAAGGLAAAAALALWFRASPVVGPLALEMQAGNSELRGSAAGPVVVLDLRNEPVWTVRLGSPDAAAAADLYLVAQHADGTVALLDAPVERQGPAFRVRSELGALGLRAGTTTLYFMVGPRGAQVEAVRRVHALVVGEPLPDAWGAVTTQFRIKG